MRDEVIKNYFNLGLNALEFALFLKSVHDIIISVRNLKRILIVIHVVISSKSRSSGKLVAAK